MDKKKLFIIIILSFLIALSSFLFVTDESLMGYSDSAFNRGFPSHFLETNSSNKITNFLPLNFLGNVFFYALIIWSVLYLIDNGKKSNKWWLLVVAIILALVWINVDIQQNSQCIAGFPIAFSNKCGDDADINQSFILLGATVDFLFWFSLSSIFITILHILSTKKVGRLKYLLAPAFITLMSFWYNTPCEGFFCIFSGRGFPLPFFVDNHWSFLIFVIDFLIWTIILYPFACGVMWFFKKMLK